MYQAGVDTAGECDRQSDPGAPTSGAATVNRGSVDIPPERFPTGFAQDETGAQLDSGYPRGIVQW